MSDFANFSFFFSVMFSLMKLILDLRPLYVFAILNIDEHLELSLLEDYS
jgi:hypothetical protein